MSGVGGSPDERFQGQPSERTGGTLEARGAGLAGLLGLSPDVAALGGCGRYSGSNPSGPAEACYLSKNGKIISDSLQIALPGGSPFGCSRAFVLIDRGLRFRGAASAPRWVSRSEGGCAAKKPADFWTCRRGVAVLRFLNP